MKYALALTLIAALTVSQGRAQSPVITSTTPTTTFIKGTESISFDGSVVNAGAKDVTDKYTLDVNVNNSARFYGSIERLPNVHKMLGSSQVGLLTYNVNLAVYKPGDPSKQRDVGRLFGEVPNDIHNVYRFEDGTLKIQTEQIGSAPPIDDSFKGLALGKPPQQTSMLGGLKKQIVDIKRSIGGQTAVMHVTNYDVMEFQQHILAAGPVQKYGAVAVNGKTLYDYDRSAWHFVGVSLVYSVGGQQHQDMLSGDIRWVEDKARASNGKGHYELDIRFNEPPPSEDAMFTPAAGSSDESSFFASDAAVPGLSGTIAYQDTLGPLPANAKAGDEGPTQSSQVVIDLHGNQISAQQTMAIAKLLFFSMTVPLNSD